MNLNIKTVCLLAIVSLLHAGCRHSVDDRTTGSIPEQKLQEWTGEIVADPIIYEVIVKNPDPDDEWGNEKIRKLKTRKIIDRIFDAVYAGNATRYNYHTGEVMSIEDISQLEASDEFDRSLIGKIQFEEDWYFDPDNLAIYKKVKSVLLAYEVYDQFNEVVGYKAAFLVHMNE